MKVQIIGRGCSKCLRLTANLEQAARELGITVDVEKVTETAQIVALGVPMTPAFAIDGVVKSWGRVLAPEQIKEILSAAREATARPEP